MTLHRTLLAIFVLLISSLSPLFAGGSITLNDLRPLLNQQPKLWHFFQDHFDISQNGGGLRLGAEGIPLRGARVPPYEFPAKMKGDQGGCDLKVTILADVYFFDADGKETSDEMKAESKKEVLLSIAVGPLKYPTGEGIYSPK